MSVRVRRLGKKGAVKRAKLIINPMAGIGRRKSPPTPEGTAETPAATGVQKEPADEIIEAVTEKCERAKIRLDVEFTKSPMHAMEISRAARNKYDLVIVAGGDGTINEVINGIAGSRTTLAIIPFGTANVFALELGIPPGVKEACELLTEGQKIQIDLGYAETKEGSRYYSMVLGIGFDALVMKDATSEFRKKWGGLAYPMLGTKHLITYKWPKINVKHSSISTGYFAIIANSRHIWGEHQLADAASMTDGLLDLVIINRDKWPAIDLILSFSRGRLNKFLKREYFQIKQAHVSAEGEVAVQADGEIIGTAPVKVKVVPKALHVIASKGWQSGGYKYAG
jgi:diacylglycerol kinase (ATP)